MHIAKPLTAALLAAGMTLSGGALLPAQAQDGAQETPAAPEVTEAKLDAFVVAAVAIEDIRASYQAPMQEAADDAERQALIEEANEEMVSAIDETQGITVDEYIAINRAAREDEELQQRIVELYEATKAEQ